MLSLNAVFVWSDTEARVRNGLEQQCPVMTAVLGKCSPCLDHSFWFCSHMAHSSWVPGSSGTSCLLPSITEGFVTGHLVRCDYPEHFWGLELTGEQAMREQNWKVHSLCRRILPNLGASPQARVWQALGLTSPGLELYSNFTLGYLNGWQNRKFLVTFSTHVVAI